MVEFEDYKPALAMFGLQFSYAGVSLFTQAALKQGMNPRIFVFYRQAIVTSVVAPIAYLSSRHKSNGCSIGLKSFCLMFLASLIGVCVNQNIYFAGMYLAYSSMANAMANLVPAVTFVMASIFGLERVNFRSWSTAAKIIGTMLCVGGAASMALLRGPKLLNSQLQPAEISLFGFSYGGGDHWLLGILMLLEAVVAGLFGSFCRHLYRQAIQITCLYQLGYVSLVLWQAGLIALFSETDPKTWILHSNFEIFCCFFAGVIGPGLTFFVQAWCILFCNCYCNHLGSYIPP